MNLPWNRPNHPYNPPKTKISMVTPLLTPPKPTIITSANNQHPQGLSLSNHTHKNINNNPQINRSILRDQPRERSQTNTLLSSEANLSQVSSRMINSRKTNAISLQSTVSRTETCNYSDNFSSLAQIPVGFQKNYSNSYESIITSKNLCESITLMSQDKAISRQNNQIINYDLKFSKTTKNIPPPALSIQKSRSFEKFKKPLNPLPKQQKNQYVLPTVILPKSKKGKSKGFNPLKNTKVVQPLSLAHPSLLLQSVKPHKIQRSNKSLPVIGVYLSNDKSKNYVIRQLSSSKTKPISLKIVGISPAKPIPTQIVRIPIRNLQIEQDDDRIIASCLTDSKSSTQSKINTLLSNNLVISMYKSPDVIIFSPQLVQGLRLQKNHIQRIAIEGKLIKQQDQIQRQAKTSSNIYFSKEGVKPLQKYFKLKQKLQIQDDFSIQRSSICQFQNTKIEGIEFEIVTKTEQFEYLQQTIISNDMEHNNTLNIRLIQSSTKQHLHTQSSITPLEHNSEIIVEQTVTDKTIQIIKQQKVSISELLSSINSSESQSRQRYIPTTLPNEILEDLRKLKQRQGDSRPLTMWYKINPN